MNQNNRAKKAAASARQKPTTGEQSDRVSTGNKTISLHKETTFAPVTVTPTITGNVDFNADSKTVDVSLPGLPNISVASIASSVKRTELHDLADVKNPGIPKEQLASKAEFERAKNEYEGGIRYQQLMQLANNFRGEEYKTIASAAKAYQQGLMATSEVEKVYQQYLELAKQKQITTEKGIAYISQAHKKATAQAALPFTVAENEAKLEQQRIKARKAYEEARQANTEFDGWLSSLNGQSQSTQR